MQVDCAFYSRFHVPVFTHGIVGLQARCNVKVWFYRPIFELNLKPTCILTGVQGWWKNDEKQAFKLAIIKLEG